MSRDHRAPLASGITSENDEDARRILQSMLALSRLVFDAPAASVFTYDEADALLRFEAASGVGADELVGSVMSADAGIAGTVIQTGIATIAGDLTGNASFNREFAAKSGYIPTSICAAPLLYGDDLLGVIEILDADLGRFGSLDVMTIVAGLADHVAASLYVLRELRQTRPGDPTHSARRRRISGLVDSLPDQVFDDGRTGVLEAVLVELGRSHAA